MKEKSTGSPSTLLGVNKAGFASLEVLIAFAVLILCISAVLLVSFSNQLLVIDSENSILALSKAKAMLEIARADSREDFNLVSSSTSTDTSHSLAFTKTLDIIQKDFFTKEVTASVSWEANARTLAAKLTTLLVNIEALNGGDTCSSVLSGDWKNPQIESSTNFSSISPSGIYTLTDVDAYKGKLYVTASKTSGITDPTFFVFDISDSAHPTLGSNLDNDALVKTGLNAVTVGNDYAYVASSSSYTRGQMQIIDLGTMAVLKTFKVPAIDSAGASKGTGNSIFYNNGNVYLGLTKSTSENEFNIIDVSDPLNPVARGKYPIGNAVNSILTHNDKVYIASPNSEELQILDITNLDSPAYLAGFNAVSGSGNGKSVYLVGDKLYLGKTTGASSDFHILNISDTTHAPPELGSRDIASSVDGVVTRDYLSFLLTGTAGTGSKLQIFRTDDLANTAAWNSPSLTLSSTGNAVEPAMDCEGNRLYISANDSAGQGTIYIIKPGT